ncbi:hypothetical protein Lal_00001011 [Lupinus albus]|nr:hypothetical protein Lal_00001011 [Lupinus albus]
MNSSISTKAKGKKTDTSIKRSNESMNNYFASITTLGVQPSIGMNFVVKDAIHRANMIVARFFYDRCILFNCANSVYNQPMIDAIAAFAIKVLEVINFLVYSPKGISFLRSIDTSDVVKKSKTHFNLFIELVEFVRVINVVQLVTENATNDKVVENVLNENFTSIYWSPCQCLHLIFEDIGEMKHVSTLAKTAYDITKFV